MTPNQRSIALGVFMVLVGLVVVLLAVLIVLPVTVNLPDSWFGAMPAILVMAIGIGFMYYGGQRIWIKEK